MTTLFLRDTPGARYPTGNGRRVEMLRDERGIAMIGQRKEPFPIRLKER